MRDGYGVSVESGGGRSEHVVVVDEEGEVESEIHQGAEHLQGKKNQS